MRGLKLVCVCSALDLRFQYGCTPGWWQYLKGLHEIGCEVIAIPYQGDVIDTPWWRAYPNACWLSGQFYDALFERGLNSTSKKTPDPQALSIEEGIAGKAIGTYVRRWMRPRWRRHLASVLEKERNVDAVLMFTVPPSFLAGIPESLRKRYSVPFVYIDGDAPVSLPSIGDGFAPGFRMYEGVDLAEYDGFLCNSVGALDAFRKMGARNAETLHWGVDPELYAPLDIEAVRDVFYYGFDDAFRKDWIRDLLVRPSILSDITFSIGGKGFRQELGKVKHVGYVPPNQLRVFCCGSRINLNIPRAPHASVFASSCLRPFELAAMGCCIVSIPCLGMDTWFDTDSEIRVVHDTDEAIRTYRELLRDESTRKAMGEAARSRVIQEHTHRHRAKQLVDFIAGL